MEEKTNEVATVSESTNMAVVEPREHLIGTAIKFLLNPKVRQSGFEQRKLFLERKGLTEEEIHIAIERSGTASDATAVQPITSQPPTAVVQPVPPASAWSRGRDYVATAIVVGGVSYAMYVFYKRYIEPQWFGPSKEQQQMNELTRGMSELQKSIGETLKHIQETQSVLSKQQEVIQDMARNYASSRGPKELDRMQDDQSLTDIKEELKSLKALLLSSRRFPAAPTTTPVLPSWQLTPTKSQLSTPTTETTVTDTNQGNRTSEVESNGFSEENYTETETSSLIQESSPKEVKMAETDELSDANASQNIIMDDNSSTVQPVTDQQASDTDQQAFIQTSDTNTVDFETVNTDPFTVEATA